MEEMRDFNPYILNSDTVISTPIWGVDGRFPSRTVRWYELELITECDQGGVIIDGSFVAAQVGGLYLRKPGMVVQGVCQYRWCNITFDSFYDPELQEEYAKPHFIDGCPASNARIFAHHHRYPLLEQLPTYMVLKDYNAAFELFHHCYSDYLANRPHFQFYAKAILFQLLHLALDELRDQQLSRGVLGTYSGVQDCIRSVKDYLEERYMDPITLETLSKRTLLSESYLCRMFKKLLGVSPIEYLIRVRVSAAQRYLSNTDNTVVEIGRLCGFRTESHFFQTFKRMTGFTPSAYRSSPPREP